jgi:hypothetical protein
MRVTIFKRVAVAVFACCITQWSTGTSVAVSFTTASLGGRWAVELGPGTSFGGTVHGNAAGVTAATRQHLMRVGFIDWDGLGGASGRFLAVTDTNSGQTMTIDYKWSGTYTVNTDGSGILSITTIELAAPAPVCNPDPPPEGGVCTDYVGAETYAFVISKRYATVRLVQQNNSGGAKIFLHGEAIRQHRSSAPFFFTSGALRKGWAFRLGPATSFSAIAPGDPGGVSTAPRQDILRVGVITFDGFGLVSGHVLATTDDNAGSTVTIDYTISGTYTINSDGTGTLAITPAFIDDTSCTPAQPPGDCATFEGTETYAFVMSKSRLRLHLMQTDNSGGGGKIFLRGVAEPS